MAGVQINCPACKCSLSIPSITSVRKQAPRKTAATKRLSWRDDPATEAQLDYLDAYGLRPDHNITKGDASDLLADAEERGLSKRNSLRQPSTFAEDIAEAKQEIAALKAKIASSNIEEKIKMKRAEVLQNGLSPQAKSYITKEIEELEEEKTDLAEELDDLKSNLEGLIEEKQSEKEDFAERIEGYLMDYGRDGQYYSYLKKPTKQQMREVITTLDAHEPDWRLKGDEAVLVALTKKYPDLIKKQKPSTQTENADSSGCLLIILALVIAVIAGMILFK